MLGLSEEEEYEDLFYDTEEELSAEVKDPKTIDAQVMVKAEKPIFEITGVLEVMNVEDESSSSSESDEKETLESEFKSASSEEDDDEILTNDQADEEEISIANSFKDLKSNALAWSILTKFFVFLGYCFAVLSLFVTFRYVQNMRRQRTFNVQPLVLSPDQHHDLVRTVNYLQTKRRGPFKYEPLEEFV